MPEWGAQRGGRKAWVGSSQESSRELRDAAAPWGQLFPAPDSQGPAGPAPHPRAGRHRAGVLQGAPGAVGKPAAPEPGGRSDRFAPGAGTDVRARSPNTSCPGPAELALLGTALLAWPCRSSEPSPAPIPAHGRQNLPGKCGRLPVRGTGRSGARGTRSPRGLVEAPVSPSCSPGCSFAAAGGRRSRGSCLRSCCLRHPLAHGGGQPAASLVPALCWQRCRRSRVLYPLEL